MADESEKQSDNSKKFNELFLEFNSIFDAVSDTFILLSSNMDVLWTNSSSTWTSLINEFSVVNRYCYRLFTDHSLDYENNPVSRCFHTGQKETSVVSQDGGVLDIRAFPVMTHGNISHVLLLLSDITEKMAMQAEILQTRHMASLGELAAGVAHEINNPVTGIINYGQILINEYLDGSFEKEIGERIVKEGERIGRIVKTLLSYAHERRKEKRNVSVSAILEESLILIQAQIKKEGIDLRINLQDKLPDVLVNFQQIQQCFINIITNARYALNEKFSGERCNKVIEITTETVDVDGFVFVRITFFDNGVGISSDELPLVTQPFFTTKPYGQGTGLGLNITRKLLSDHGGKLRFESIKGDYTRVFIDLPTVWSQDCKDNQ